MNNFDDVDDGGYYGGGCFHGNCLIQMFDGSSKLVKHLKMGDSISTSENQQTNVVCVVKTKTYSNSMRMCQFDGGLLITPGHPIK